MQKLAATMGKKRFMVISVSVFKNYFDARIFERETRLPERAGGLGPAGEGRAVGGGRVGHA